MMRLQRLVIWIFALVLIPGCSGLRVTRLEPPHLPSPGASPVVASDKSGIRYYLPHPVAIISTVDQFQGNTLDNRNIKVEIQLLPDPAHYYAVDLAQSLFTDDSFTVTLGPGQTLASVDVTRASQLVEVAKFAAQLAGKATFKTLVKDTKKPQAPEIPEACKMVPKDPPKSVTGPELWLENINKSLDKLLKSPSTAPDRMTLIQSLLDARTKVEPLTIPVEKVKVIGQRKVTFLAKGMKPGDIVKGFSKTLCWDAVVFAEPLDTTDQ